MGVRRPHEASQSSNDSPPAAPGRGRPRRRPPAPLLRTKRPTRVPSATRGCPSDLGGNGPVATMEKKIQKRRRRPPPTPAPRARASHGKKKRVTPAACASPQRGAPARSRGGRRAAPQRCAGRPPRQHTVTADPPPPPAAATVRKTTAAAAHTRARTHAPGGARRPARATPSAPIHGPKRHRRRHRAGGAARLPSAAQRAPPATRRARGPPPGRGGAPPPGAAAPRGRQPPPPTTCQHASYGYRSPPIDATGAGKGACTPPPVDMLRSASRRAVRLQRRSKIKSHSSSE